MLKIHVFWTPDASRSGSYKIALVIYWTPDASRSGSYKITLVIITSDPFFSETALTIFMKLCTMLDNDKRKKVTKPDYPKKF